MAARVSHCWVALLLRRSLAIAGERAQGRRRPIDPRPVGVAQAYAGHAERWCFAVAGRSVVG
jgi:hypothetical protein